MRRPTQLAAAGIAVVAAGSAATIGATVAHGDHSLAAHTSTQTQSSLPQQPDAGSLRLRAEALAAAKHEAALRRSVARAQARLAARRAAAEQAAAAAAARGTVAAPATIYANPPGTRTVAAPPASPPPPTHSTTGASGAPSGASGDDGGQHEAPEPGDD